MGQRDRNRRRCVCLCLSVEYRGHDSSSGSLSSTRTMCLVGPGLVVPLPPTSQSQYPRTSWLDGVEGGRGWRRRGPSGRGLMQKGRERVMGSVFREREGGRGRERGRGKGAGPVFFLLRLFLHHFLFFWEGCGVWFVVCGSRTRAGVCVGWGWGCVWGCVGCWMFIIHFFCRCSAKRRDLFFDAATHTHTHQHQHTSTTSTPAPAHQQQREEDRGGGASTLRRQNTQGSRAGAQVH